MGCNCALDTTDEMVPMYGHQEFKPEWRLQRTTFKVTQELVERFVPNTAGVIKPATEVPFEELLYYDTSVHVYPRM